MYGVFTCLVIVRQVYFVSCSLSLECRNNCRPSLSLGLLGGVSSKAINTMWIVVATDMLSTTSKAVVDFFGVYIIAVPISSLIIGMLVVCSVVSFRLGVYCGRRKVRKPEVSPPIHITGKCSTEVYHSDKDCCEFIKSSQHHLLRQCSKCPKVLLRG